MLAWRSPLRLAKSFASTSVAAVPTREQHAVLACAQIRAVPCISENLESIKRNIIAASSHGADVVAFPETALTGYFPDVIQNADPAVVRVALQEIAETCGDAKISAIVGSPVYDDGLIRNSALVFGPEGERCIY